MDLYLIEKDTGWRLPWCLLPDKVKAKTTSGFISYEFISVGEVKIPNGQKLRTYSWSGTFPGLGMKRMPFIKQSLYYTPKEMVSCIEKWRTNHTELKLMLTETPLYANVYLKSFSYEPSGGTGNIDYSIEFIEAKPVTVYTVKEAKTTESAKSSNISSGSRPTTNSTKTNTKSEQTKTYTVKKNDNLWNISKAKLGSGARYGEIYRMNRTVIGNNPDLIRPGMVLLLPY